MENKVDLLDFEDDSSLEEFNKRNEFCGYFRTSAKTGVNVAESMKYLIRIIIKRIEDIESKGIKIFTNQRKHIVLDPEKHIAANSSKRKNDGGCC